MRKLFLFIAAVLASFSLWAADPAPVDNPATKKYGDITFLDVAGTVANRTDKQAKEYLTYGVYYVAKTKAITTWFNSSDGKPGSNHETTGYSITDAEDYGFFPTSSTSSDINYGGTKCHSERQRYFYVTGATSVAGIVRDGGTSSNKYAQMLIQTVAEDGTLGTATTIGDDYVSAAAGYVLDGGELDPAKYYKISFTSPVSSNCYMYQIRLGKTANCADPESTIKADTTLYAGASYNIGFNSINTNGCTVDVKKNGAAAADDVDYSKTNINNYTFLKAGEFVITISQAADGTHCAVEESVTVTVNEATPVKSVTIGDAAHSARIGGSVELSATAANATEYQWFLNDEEIEGAETDSYTFNATAGGSYSFVCKARNDFNSGTWIASSAHVITVTVGTDATLSDLKVNGSTVTGFAADKYEYALGELGVYEALAVTATAADAPYATTAVVDDKAGTITVTVTAEDNTIQDYVLTYSREAKTGLVAINGSTTWDWTKTGVTSDLKLTDATFPSKAEEFNFADLLTNPDASFKAESLKGIMEYVYRAQSSFKFCQGTQLYFETTVPGTMEIVYSNTNDRSSEDDRRFVVVNGAQYGNGTLKASETVTTSGIAIVAGGVTITSKLKKDGSASMLRFMKITFTKSETTSIDNTSDVVKAQKRIENGQLIIEKNGVRYNAMGQAIR